MSAEEFENIVAGIYESFDYISRNSFVRTHAIIGSVKTVDDAEKEVELDIKENMDYTYEEFKKQGLLKEELVKSEDKTKRKLERTEKAYKTLAFYYALLMRSWGYREGGKMDDIVRKLFLDYKSGIKIDLKELSSDPKFVNTYLEQLQKLQQGSN